MRLNVLETSTLEGRASHPVLAWTVTKSERVPVSLFWLLRRPGFPLSIGCRLLHTG
jgi:hypothetical protein